MFSNNFENESLCKLILYVIVCKLIDLVSNLLKSYIAMLLALSSLPMKGNVSYSNTGCGAFKGGIQN